MNPNALIVLFASLRRSDQNDAVWQTFSQTWNIKLRRAFEAYLELRPATDAEVATRIAAELKCARGDDMVNSQCWDTWDQRFTTSVTKEAPVILSGSERTTGRKLGAHALVRIHRSPLTAAPGRHSGPVVVSAKEARRLSATTQLPLSPAAKTREQVTSSAPPTGAAWHELSPNNLNAFTGQSVSCVDRCGLLQRIMRRSAHATKLASLAADEGQEGEWDLVAEVSDMLWERGLHLRGLDNDVSEVNVGRNRLNPLPQDLVSLVTEADKDTGDVQGRDFSDPRASIVEGKSSQ